MADFTLDDFFGPMPHRPEHDDFWRLSSVLLKMDGDLSMHEAHPLRHSQEAADAHFERLMSEISMDQASLLYAAQQRAFRVLGVTTMSDFFLVMEKVGQTSTAWLDGFVAGALYEKSKGHGPAAPEESTDG